MRLKCFILGAWHYRAKEDRLEVTAVIGEMAMWLAEGRDDLWHFQAEDAFVVRQCGAVALRITLITFGGVRPNLNPHVFEQSAVCRSAHRARHPKPTAANAFHDRGTGQVIVCPSPH